MKTLYSVSAVLISLCLNTTVFAADYPQGGLSFHNATGKTVTAQISTIGKVNIAANEQKTVSYSTLAQVCPSQTKCTANFYVDNTPVGTATLNVVTGKLISMNLNNMKVHTGQSHQVLRSVVIQ